MKGLKTQLSLGVALACLLSAPFAAAQEQPSSQDLKKDIEAIKESQKAIQKDLQDIKALLQRGQPAPPPQNVVLDLANNPSKGENKAKLTLVEFSDYQ